MTRIDIIEFLKVHTGICIFAFIAIKFGVAF